MATKKYVDLTGLTEFKSKLLNAYSKNDQDKFADFAVAKATAAGSATKATQDADGNVISSTYLKVADQIITSVDTDSELTLTNKKLGIDLSAYLKSANEFVKSVAANSKISVTDGVIDVDLSLYALKSDLTKVLKFMGVVDYVKDLPTASADTIGHIYHVKYRGESGTTALNAEYVGVDLGEGADPRYKFEEMGSIVDLSNYYTKTEVNNLLDDKADVTSVEAIYKNDGGTESGVLITKIAAEKSRAEGAEGALDTRVTANETAITKLNGTVSTEGSVKYEAKAAVDAITVTAGTGDYVTGITYANGVITETKAAKGTITGAATDSGLVDGATVKAYVDGKAHNDHTYTFTSCADGAEGQFKYKEFLNGTQVGDEHTITVGADKNVLEGVKVNGTALTIADKAVDIDLSAYTDQTLVTNSAEPCSSAAVLAAGYQVAADLQSVTNAEIDGLFPSES